MVFVTGLTLMAPITLENPEAGQGPRKGGQSKEGFSVRVTAGGSKWAWVVLPKGGRSSHQVAFLKGDLGGKGSRVVIALPEAKASPRINTSGETDPFFKSVQVFPLRAGMVGVFFEPLKPFGFRVLSDRVYFYARHPNNSSLIRLRRVLIDPGHGGKDPGAVGPGGVLEKDVTLMLAKELAGSLKNLGFSVFLTRSDDRFIPLEQRTQMANSLKADLLISIHTNASDDASQTGFEGYVWGEPTDPQASKVALRENKGSIAKPKEIEALIGRLQTNAAQALSAMVASLTLDSLIKELGSTPRGVLVKKAPFVVLQGLDIPAFLLEAGFITNPKTAVELKSQVFQKKLAHAMTQAIQTFKDSDERVILGAI